MPNHCMNSITIKGEPAFIERLALAAEEGELLNFIKPMPMQLRETPKGSWSDDAKTKEVQLQNERNIKEHGYMDWYDFANAEWGTKWDIYDQDVERIEDGVVLIIFNTAWAPPINAYDTLSQMDEVVEFNATWYEPGMQFIGFKSHAGPCLNIDLEMERDFIDNLPPLLLDHYGDMLYDMLDSMEEGDLD